MRPPAIPASPRRLALAAILTAAWAAPAAQSPPREATARSDANYVRLDVFASSGTTPVTDLTAADFEVLEDGRPQQIESFERVKVAPDGPRARLFVLFLDEPHLSTDAARQLTGPVAAALDRTVGPDDLVAVMTPHMTAANLSFERKTMSFGEMLGTYWAPGGRFEVDDGDPLEREYERCFPPATEQGVSATAQEMIDRRRERQTLDALIDLVKHLTTARSERKAVLVFSEGWPRLKPNPGLIGRTEGSTAPRPKVGPDGRPTPAFNPRDSNAALLFKCEADRRQLAQLDNDRGFRWLMDEANNANVSFFPLDPRKGPGAAARDAAGHAGATRAESLSDIAAATDGRALAGGPELQGDLARIAGDLGAYYLIGYYSNNTRRDGAFRTVTARSTRPGVDVRTRRGYRAPRSEESTSSRVDRSAIPIPTSRSATPNALGKLVEFRGDEAFRMQAIAGVATAGERRIWVLGELTFRAAQATEWRNGAQATVMVSSDGETLVKAEVALDPGTRTFLTSVAAPADPGAYLVQVQLLPSGGGPQTLADAERVTVSDPKAAGSPRLQPALVFRRGPSTGIAYLPTADVRFRRNESIRVAAPVAHEARDPAIRLLGRNGSVIDVPIAASIEPTPAPGVTIPASFATDWLVGQTPLSPLATGEYVLELIVTVGGEPHKVHVPVRVIP